MGAADEKIEGHFRVRWVSGLLPPLGISKRINVDRGVTKILSVPLMPFRVKGRELRYIGLPIHDLLVPQPDGSYLGEGYVFGIRFCRFRLDPA